MTYVVTESCIRCKYTDCVDVCPVDCFREGPNFLVIDPDECIDCTLCVAECPVEAIFAEDDVPPDQESFKAINAELSKVWKPIIERKPAPADADRMRNVPGMAGPAIDPPSAWKPRSGPPRRDPDGDRDDSPAADRPPGPAGATRSPDDPAVKFYKFS